MTETPSWQLFKIFLKVGALSFGGGPASISMMQKDLTEKTALTPDQFADGLALGNALPGPIISNMAVFAGLKLGGFGAAMVAVGGALLPSVVIMAAGATLFAYYRDTAVLQAAMKAIKPTVLALLAFTVYKLAPVSMVSYSQVGIGLVMLGLMISINLHPALAICLAGLSGVLLFR